MNPEEAALINEILAGDAPAPAPVDPAVVAPEGMEPAPIAPVEGVQQPAAPAPQPALVDPNMPPPAAPQPQMTPEMYQMMMAEQLRPLQEQLQAQNAPQPTDEELAIKQLKEQLGLTGIEEQNKQMQQQIQAYEQQQAQQAMQNAVNTFKQGKTDNAEQIVMDEINRIAQTNPELARQYQMQPMVWDYIYQAKVGASQPQAQPDPIVGTGNSGAAPERSAFDRAAAGEKVSQIDFGLDLLKTAQG